MFVHFYFSNDTFVDLIRYRILDAYRPLVPPVNSPEASFPLMDGLENIQLKILTGPEASTFDFQLNVPGSNPSDVVAAPGVSAVTESALTLSFDAELFLVSSVDLPSDPDPGTGDYPRPNRFPVYPSARIKIYTATASDGVPVLKVEPYDLNIPGTSPISFAQDVRLPLGAALSDIVGPQPRVLNTGIARTSDGAAVVIRIEATDPQLGLPGDRLAAWNAFFSGQQPSRLGIRAWAAEAPTAYLVQQVQSSFDQQMQSFGVEKYFENYDPSNANWVWDGAQIVVSKDGYFDHVCSGLDVQATITVTLTLSVPQTDTIRVSLHMDVDRDDWDSFKCGLLSFINPFSGLITSFDNSTIVPWYVGVPLSVLGRIVLPLAMLYLGITGNEALVAIALKKAQDSASDMGYNVVRTSDTDAYLDIQAPLGDLGSAAFLHLQEIVGVQDRIVIRGDYRPPNFTVPLYVKGTLLNGFDFWQKPKCSTPTLSAFKTVAMLQLSLLDPGGKNILYPAISTKCGITSDTGITMCWRIPDDAGGMYSGDHIDINWTGAGLGVFEIAVLSPTQAFIDDPQPLHFQLFTNYGVRRFNIAPPKKPPHIPATPQEVLAEAAQRISECYAISSLLARIKALQFVWLPDPPPDYRGAQHWQIQIEGLRQGDRLHAWDPSRGKELADVAAWGGTFGELSLLNDGEAMRSMQITLNDQPLLSEENYRKLAASVEGKSETALNPVQISQTQLLHLTEIPLPGRANSLNLRVTRAGITINAWDDKNDWEIAMPPRAVRSWTIVRTDRQERRRSALPSSEMRLAHSTRDGQRITQLLDAGGAEIGRFFLRPWYDRGSAAKGYYARLNDAGDKVVLFARLKPKIAYPSMS